MAAVHSSRTQTIPHVPAQGCWCVCEDKWALPENHPAPLNSKPRLIKHSFPVFLLDVIYTFSKAHGITSKWSWTIRISLKGFTVDKEHIQPTQLEGIHFECPFSNSCNNLIPLVSVSTVNGLNGPCSVPSDNRPILGHSFYARITAANCKALVLDTLKCCNKCLQLTS